MRSPVPSDKDPVKCRQISLQVQTSIVRGILKRPSRSLSESNLDEYVLSDIPSSAIGSEECIASENCETCAEDHVTQKKTVRFSDHIGRKIFR